MSAFDDELKVAATEWLKLKSKLEAIEKDFKTLDETLKNKMHESNVKSIEIGDTVIELTVPARRSFDAAVLKDLVSASVFNKVTKPTVDTQLMRRRNQNGDNQTRGGGSSNKEDGVQTTTSEMRNLGRELTEHSFGSSQF